MPNPLTPAEAEAWNAAGKTRPPHDIAAEIEGLLAPYVEAETRRRASKTADDIQRALNDRLAAWKGMIGKAPELMAEAAAALRARPDRASVERRLLGLFDSGRQYGDARANGMDRAGHLVTDGATAIADLLRDLGYGPEEGR